MARKRKQQGQPNVVGQTDFAGGYFETPTVARTAIPDNGLAFAKNFLVHQPGLAQRVSPWQKYSTAATSTTFINGVFSTVFPAYTGRRVVTIELTGNAYSYDTTSSTSL